MDGTRARAAGHSCGALHGSARKLAAVGLISPHSACLDSDANLPALGCLCAPRPGLSGAARPPLSPCREAAPAGAVSLFAATPAREPGAPRRPAGSKRTPRRPRRLWVVAARGTGSHAREVFAIGVLRSVPSAGGRRRLRWQEIWGGGGIQHPRGRGCVLYWREGGGVSVSFGREGRKRTNRYGGTVM